MKKEDIETIGGLIILIIISVIIFSVGLFLGQYKFPRTPEVVYITKEEKDCNDKGGRMHYYPNMYADGKLEINSWECVIPEKVINSSGVYYFKDLEGTTTLK